MLKNFYTAQELNELSPEEILELSSFGGEGQGTTFYYSQIEEIKMAKIERGFEYSIRFKNTEEVFTKNSKLIEEIKTGKARFDLITRSLEEVQRNKDTQEEFYKKVQGSIQNEMQNVHQQIRLNRINFDNSITEMQNKVEKSTDTMDEKVKKLNTVDIEKFEKLMSQMETITEAFSTLMVD